MKTQTIPLILPATARGWQATVGTSAKDQQLINSLYQVSSSPLAGSKAVFAQKRPGSETSTDFGASSPTLLKSYSYELVRFATAGSPLQLYIMTVLSGISAQGIITDPVDPATNLVLADAIVGSKYVVAFVTTAGTGWFWWSDSGTNNTFTGDRTSGSPIITNIASTTGRYPGQAISGTGIPAATRILTVDSGTQITLTANATSGAPTSTTLTTEPVAKIIDAQFPSDANSIEALDGYFFVGTDDGEIYQSALNDPSSWASADVINADYAGDGLRFIFKWQNYIVAAGLKGTIQYFYNAGNASGSVLSAAENLNISGVNLMSRPVSMGGVGYCTAYGTSNLVSGLAPVSLYSLSGINSYQPIHGGTWHKVLAWNSMLYVDPIVSGDGNYILIRPSAGTTTPVIYDPATGEFSAFLLGAALTSAFTRNFTKSAATELFVWSQANTWTDSNSAYTLTAQTQPYTLNNGSPFVITHVDLIADTEASGTATLYISRDDYATWENVGTFDMTAQKKRIHALGWCQSNAAFKVEHSADTNFRAQALMVSWK